MTAIKYSVSVDGTEHTHTVEVESDRAGWNPDVAKQYANHDAVDQHGFGVDVTHDVEVIRMGDPHDQYDETGGCR